jgi:leucine-zipper of insertion element IS481
MAHRSARLTQFGRLLLVQRITELRRSTGREPRTCSNLSWESDA